MKIALNGATTMHADLETDIRAAGAAGFDLVELWASKLRTYLASHTIAELRARVDEMVTSLIRRTFRVYTTEPMDVVGCNDRKIGNFIALVCWINDPAVADDRVHGVAIPPQR